MSYFIDISHLHQTVLLTCMFSMLLLSILCIGISSYSICRILCVVTDSIQVLVLFIFTKQCVKIIRCLNNDQPMTISFHVPVWVLWCITMGVAVWLGFQVVYGLLRMRSTVGVRSVKYAFDSLPAAVCYFNTSGTVKLCNCQMDSLFRSMTQGDLQQYCELQDALAECKGISGIIRLSEEQQTYIFPDGKVWKYQENDITDRNGIKYTEAIFSDVTELYEKHMELERRNKELKEMFREIRDMSDNVLEMTRQNEILTAKTNLHDRMGAGIVAIRQSLLQNHTSKENAEAIDMLFDAIRIIKNDNNSPVGRSELEEFIHNASVVGVNVEITGRFPEEESIRNLILQAMKECCTNGVQHGGASLLMVRIIEQQESVCVCIANNGTPPEGEVVPKGGLLNLVSRVLEYGGKMEIHSSPQFEVTMTLPVEMADKKEEA